MRAVRRIASWGVLVALFCGLGAEVLAWHEGYRAYAIKTGSMTPVYPAGSLVVDRPVGRTPPSVGDVITFGTKDGLVTHRVHAIKDGGIETKGDANRTPDVGLVPFGDVAGEVVWGAAQLGYVFVFFQQPTGALSLMLLALSVYLAWTLFFPANAADAASPRAREAEADGDTGTPSGGTADVTSADHRPAGGADLVVLTGTGRPSRGGSSSGGSSGSTRPVEIDLSGGAGLEQVGPTLGQPALSPRPRSPRPRSHRPRSHRLSA